MPGPEALLIKDPQHRYLRYGDCERESPSGGFILLHTLGEELRTLIFLSITKE